MANPENGQSIGKVNDNDKFSMDEIFKKIADASQTDREHLIAVASGISLEKFYDDWEI